MSTVSATRSELLARRAREATARRGHDLISQKRSALIVELRKIGHEVSQKRADLEQTAARARRALHRAQAIDSPEAVRSAGHAARRDVSAQLGSRSVAGVRVMDLQPDRVTRSRADRGYALTASTATIDSVAESFETEMEALLDLAAAEVNLRRLVAEVARTTRQINALEHVVIPRLVAEQRVITGALDQRTLEDRIRITRRAGANDSPAGGVR
jgi:V/A-type H+-transporting ATPase subunit D